MDATNDAALPGGAPTDIVQVPAPAGEAISTRDAARSLASFRLKARETEHDTGLFSDVLGTINTLAGVGKAAFPKGFQG